MYVFKLAVTVSSNKQSPAVNVQFKILRTDLNVILTLKLEKKYAPTLDNYEQSCFVRSDFLKMKCVCKTQMMPLPDHKKL
jgi:hypothetical protein